MHNQRKLLPPTTQHHPRQTLVQPNDTRHNRNLHTLSKLRKYLHVDVEPVLRLELFILDKLYYRNRNQHRSALFHRKFQELRRVLKRWQELGLAGLVDDVLKVFRGTSKHAGEWQYVPDGAYMAWFILRLQGATQLLAHVQACCVTAYKQHDHMSR
jgi:hypothetical protein